MRETGRGSQIGREEGEREGERVESTGMGIPHGERGRGIGLLGGFTGVRDRGRLEWGCDDRQDGDGLFEDEEDRDVEVMEG